MDWISERGATKSPGGVAVMVDNQPVFSEAAIVPEPTVSIPRSPLVRLSARASSALLGLGAVCAAGICVAMVFGGARPAWWRAGQPVEQRRALAGAVDNQAWTVITELRGMSRQGEALRSEPWSVSLTSVAATAWVNEKLPGWLRAQRHPAALPEGAELQAAFEPGVVRIGVRSRQGRYLSLSVRPRIDAQGLWLPVTDAAVGRLAVPSGAILSEHAGGVPGFSSETAAVLLGRTPALPGGFFRLPDGRRVRLLGVEPRQDCLVLTMQTESAR